MTPVWDVVPHSQANDREGPGSFREHDIQAFPEGMTPPSWLEVPAAITKLDRRPPKAPGTLSRRSPVSRGACFGACPLRADPPLPRWQRSYRKAPAQSHPGAPGFPPGDHLQGRSSARPRRSSTGRPGGLWSLGEFLARAILDNLYKFVVPAVAGPARLVALPALPTPTLSANALRVAAIRGCLKAAKAADGTWRSSRFWVNEYAAGRYSEPGRYRTQPSTARGSPIAFAAERSTARASR